jgi:hypothetical protein
MIGWLQSAKFATVDSGLNFSLLHDLLLQIIKTLAFGVLRRLGWKPLTTASWTSRVSDRIHALMRGSSISKKQWYVSS